MYPTDLEETQWQVIKKILNVQERKQKYDGGRVNQQVQYYEINLKLHFHLESIN